MCGLPHSSAFTGPVKVMVFVVSNSAEMEWCAITGIADTMTPTARIKSNNFRVINPFPERHIAPKNDDRNPQEQRTRSNGLGKYRSIISRPEERQRLEGGGAIKQHQICTSDD